MENTAAVRDWRGRSYLVGPVPSDRARMFWLAWAAMVAIGPLQYGYAALLTRDGAALVPLAVWIVCQAAGALPALRLVRRRRLGVRAALGAGAALSGLGLLTLALTAGSAPLSAVLLGYAVLGGLGAGLVYGVCGEVVSSWHPERPATRVGLLTGAFGYGALPLIVWVSLVPDALPAAFLTAAVLAWTAIAAAARFLRLAPERWWPDTVDPRSHALDAAILRRTPGPLREFSLPQALRTGALPTLAGVLVCAGAVSIFDVIVVAGTGAWGPLAVLVALNGAGRALAMRCSEAFGRRRVLTGVLTLLAAGQVLLAAGWSASPGAAVVTAPLWLGAVTAGAAGGAFYPLVASLVRDYFGAERTGQIHAVVYSAKAVAGIGGVALAAIALTAPGGALLAAAAVAGLTAAAGLRLRAPGLPATIPV
ncbi:MFS transporter [Nonomuraea cavernae]|uniref:MFS transporter n=1 Tax=Nonomuraea cavernae TaxID=2045107 RepID=A0A917YRE7_9ACTN|nr:MFS transporter [Nonomuraea cavernae]MCA2184281.1 MFS transporter [Nonomuraea cavernae]GGO64282.1 MFS transporter [Nonomuraea cavernae]